MDLDIRYGRASPSLEFYNGQVMPLFGYGTWLSSKGTVGEGVRLALGLGYKHTDCASCYENEAEVGETFEKYFASNKREDIFITSKLWVKDFTKVREAFEKTLSDLKLTYLDLYLIHLPFELEKDLSTMIPMEKGKGVIGYSAERVQEIWKEMEKLVDDGLVKSIGISNFTIKKTEDLLSSNPRIMPACNQVELNPYLPQKGLLEYCNKKNIAMVAFSPLGNPGFIGEKDGVPSLFDDPVLRSIANNRKVTVAQILIAWGLGRETGVLVKSVTESRIKENLESINIKLDTDEMNAINSIDKRYRFIDQSWARKIDEETDQLWDGELLG